MARLPWMPREQGLNFLGRSQQCLMGSLFPGPALAHHPPSSPPAPALLLASGWELLGNPWSLLALWTHHCSPGLVLPPSSQFASWLPYCLACSQLVSQTHYSLTVISTMPPASKEALCLIPGETSAATGITQPSLSSGEARPAAQGPRLVRRPGHRTVSPGLSFSHDTTCLPPV